jgi:tripartite-type tricarboxylate transporter receptor subunit TctC
MLGAGAFAGFGEALAQGYPSRPVKMIVPFAPAGPTDVIARLIALKLSERLGQQFYVENHAGAGGNTGTGMAAGAAPDGYTILVVSTGFVVNPSLYAKVPYDPIKDFTPVTLAAASPNVFTVHPSVPAKTITELADLIKANPGKYSYAHASTGSTPHLSGELFKLHFKLDLVTVPFNGAGPAIQSTIAGHTPIVVTALPPAIANVKEGKLRALAVTSGKRSQGLPDVPTMAEAGIAGQEAETLTGFVVPARTPKAIVDLLHKEIVASVALPDVKQRLLALGFEPIANTPEEFAARIDAEIPKWRKVVTEAKIKIE